MGGPFIAFGGFIFVFALVFGGLSLIIGRDAAEAAALVTILVILIAAVVLFLLETFVFGNEPFTRFLHRIIGTTRSEVVTRETSSSDDDPVDWD